mmetsp:Transcript_2406/g.7214  ORF Transcript_2406/g.7214 Transcript_2406/m.7214 type:complete len:203 (+) Transcript_2406:681-1289(+)
MVVAGDADVTAVAPEGGPLVLDLPVVLAHAAAAVLRVRGAVPHQHHAVVQLILLVLAGGVVVDAAAVEAEGGLRRVDADGQRALGVQRFLHSLRVPSLDGPETLDAHGALVSDGFGVVLAEGVGAAVRVVILQGQVVAAVVGVLARPHQIVEGALVQATIAGFVVGVPPAAVHELLLRKQPSLTCLHEVGSLHCADGAEGPA